MMHTNSTSIPLSAKVPKPQKELKDYYVYAASIWDEVVYVGMGRNERVTHVNSGCSHNADLNRLHSLHGYISVEKIKEGMTKEQASKEELRNIQMYIPICNKQGSPLGMYMYHSVKRYTIASVDAFFLGVVQHITDAAPSKAKRCTASITEVARLLIGVLGNPYNMHNRDIHISAPHVKSKVLVAFPAFYGKELGDWEFLKAIISTDTRMQNSAAMWLFVTAEFREWYVAWYKYCFDLADNVRLEKELTEGFKVDPYIH